MAPEWVEAGRVPDLPPGRVILVTGPDDLRIAVCNVDGELYAIEDVCTHDGGSLDQGELDGVGDRVPPPRGPLRRPHRRGRP